MENLINTKLAWIFCAIMVSSVAYGAFHLSTTVEYSIIVTDTDISAAEEKALKMRNDIISGTSSDIAIFETDPYRQDGVWYIHQTLHVAADTKIENLGLESTATTRIFTMDAIVLAGPIMGLLMMYLLVLSPRFKLTVE